MITTLPITPNASGRFQTLLGIFIAWAYATFAQEPGFLALNLTGERLKTLDVYAKEQLRDAYHACTQRIGLSPLTLWTDTDMAYARYASECLEYLNQKHLLFQRIAAVLLCPCGAVEVLASTPLLSTGAKTYILEASGKLTCKLCKKIAKEERRNALFLRLPASSCEGLTIYPSWIVGEAREMLRRFSDVDMLVSRSRRTTSLFIDRQSGFALDPDFFWSFFSGYLSKKVGASSITLSTSNRTIRQALRVGQMERILGNCGPISVIASPTFQLKGKDGETVSLSTDEFSRSAEPEILRYLLALSLAWGAKEATLDTSRLYWVKHSIYPNKIVEQKNNEAPQKTINAFLNICSKSTAERLVAKLRKKQLLSNQESSLQNLLHNEV